MDLERFLCLEEPLECFTLEMHCCMFGASVGAWRLECLEDGALEVCKCIFGSYNC